MSAVDVSVAIVSFNTLELLDRALAALPDALAPFTYEAIVVDNGSRDGTPEMVRDRHPRTVLIESSENMGFARATNLALSRAAGRVGIWLNPDCIAPRGSLAALVAHLDREPAVGAAGPRLVFADGSPQPSAQAFPGVARVVGHVLGLRVALRGRLRGLVARFGGEQARTYIEGLDEGGDARVVDWVSGACLAMRLADAERFGPLDEGYFLYCEDADWCLRVHRAGLAVHFLPAVTVVHHAGASGPSNPFTTYHFYRSLLRYFRKNRPESSPVIESILAVVFTMRGLGGGLSGTTAASARATWWRLARLCWSPQELLT